MHRWTLAAALLTLGTLATPVGAEEPEKETPNRLGIGYWLQALDDKDLKKRFDAPQLHHILVVGDFAITRGVGFRMATGYGRFTADNVESNALGEGEFQWSQVPIEPGVRLNPISHYNFMPYVAVGPGVYLINMKNTSPNAGNADENLVGLGAWGALGLDIRFNKLVGMGFEAHYAYAEAEIDAMEDRCKVGGPGARASFLLFF